MPRSTASRRRALTASAPARWPSTTGRPRACAQRPLPSVMIATCRPSPSEATLDLEDLGFLVLQGVVELLDLVVRELLQLDLAPVLVVGAGLALVAQLAQVV